MAYVSRGTCQLCGKDYTRAGMTRHIQACRKRQASSAPAKGAPVQLMHIVVQGEDAPHYWLHLQAPTTFRLSELDRFLRDIWLECCGHESMFSTGDTDYVSWQDRSRAMNPGFLGTVRQARSMSARLKETVQSGDRLTYTYDMGSSTALTIRVVDEYSLNGAPKSIEVLARNHAPVIDCDCGQPAQAVCPELIWDGDFSGFMCTKCLKGHTCESESHLPVVNSPRVGVCGYLGSSLPDGNEDHPEHEAAAASESASGNPNRDALAAVDELNLSEAIERLVATASALTLDPNVNWFGARRPNSVMEVGQPPITPDMILWLENPSGNVLGLLPIDTQSDGANPSTDDFTIIAQEVEAFRTILERPASPAVPRLPAKVVVVSETLAVALRTALQPLGVTVRVLKGPDAATGIAMLDAVLDDMLHMMFKSSPSLLTIEALPEKTLARGFSAAAQFYKAAPWDKLPSHKALEIQMGETTYHAIVMGSEGIVQGLAVYSNGAALSDFFDTGVASDDSGIASIGMIFGESAEVHPKALEIVNAKGLELATASAFPLFARTHTHGSGPLTVAEFEVVVASLQAITLFVGKHGAKLKRGVRGVITDTLPVRTSSAIGVSLRYPDPLVR